MKLFILIGVAGFRIDSCKRKMPEECTTSETKTSQSKMNRKLLDGKVSENNVGQKKFRFCSRIADKKLLDKNTDSRIADKNTFTQCQSISISYL